MTREAEQQREDVLKLAQMAADAVTDNSGGSEAFAKTAMYLRAYAALLAQQTPASTRRSTDSDEHNEHWTCEGCDEEFSDADVYFTTADDVKLCKPCWDDLVKSTAELPAQQTPAQIAEGKAIDLGPHPQCSRCKGSGEADNAQFTCSCRWSNSPLRFTAESTALLRSAHAIAVRKGADTAWERFAASIQALGIGPVTARTYRVLPSDLETDK